MNGLRKCGTWNSHRGTVETNLRTMGLLVRSLALLSALRSSVAMSCRARRCGSDPKWLWLWRKPAATALIRPLGWEAPYATGAAIKGKRQEKKKEIVLYLYNGILLSHKKDKMMPFSATWMGLEILILSEVNQQEKDKYHMPLISFFFFFFFVFDISLGHSHGI